MALHKVQKDLPMEKTVEPIDFSGLWDISDGKKNTLIDILKSIENGVREYPEKISMAFRSGDAKVLREVTHKTKSCTNYLYHNELTALLQQIEKAALEKKLDSSVKEKIARVNYIAESILPDLNFHLEQLKEL